MVDDACRGIDINGSLAAAWKDMTDAGVKKNPSQATSADRSALKPAILNLYLRPSRDLRPGEAGAFQTFCGLASAAPFRETDGKACADEKQFDGTS